MRWPNSSPGTWRAMLREAGGGPPARAAAHACAAQKPQEAELHPPRISLGSSGRRLAISTLARVNLNLGSQRAMHWTLVGYLHQPAPLVFR